MKWLKRFSIFEDLQTEIDKNLIDDYLIDFKQMGFSIEISVSSSVILDFEKKRLERKLTNDVINLENSYYIKSDQIHNYTHSITKKSLTIGLGNLNKKEINIEELELAYDMLSNLLLQEYGLRPNYIYILKIHLTNRTGGGYGGQYLYFKDFQSIRDFLKVKDATDLENLTINGLHLGFYK